MQPDYQAEFAHLRRLAAEHTGRGYPQAFRQRAVKLEARLKKQGWTRRRIVDALGVSRPTLRRWLKMDGDDASPASSAPGLRPVQIAASTVAGHKLSVVSPGGWRIEGLGLGELVELMEALP